MTDDIVDGDAPDLPEPTDKQADEGPRNDPVPEEIE